MGQMRLRLSRANQAAVQKQAAKNERNVTIELNAIVKWYFSLNGKDPRQPPEGGLKISHG